MAGMSPFGGLGGGSKETGSGAASTKKSAKASKLARMTEEEKVCLSIFVRREKQAEVLATDMSFHYSCQT